MPACVATGLKWAWCFFVQGDALIEVFNTSKEVGPLWSHTREAWQSPEEADTLSAAGLRARGAESAGASLCFGHQADTYTCTPTYTV